MSDPWINRLEISGPPNDLAAVERARRRPRRRSRAHALGILSGEAPRQPTRVVPVTAVP